MGWNPFKSKPTLSELQEQNEYYDEELSLKKKKAMIKELESKGGDRKWFSLGGGNFNFSAIKTWIQNH